MSDESPEFVDTNVLLYAYDRSAGEKHEKAARLVGDLGSSRLGAISIQVLQEFFVVATRRIAQPLNPSDAIARLQILSRWRIHTPGPQDVLASAVLSESHQLSYWDAAIINSAATLGCRVLWSEDLHDGQRFGDLRVDNPFRS